MRDINNHKSIFKPCVFCFSAIGIAGGLIFAPSVAAQETEIILVTADKLGSSTLQEMAAAVDLKTGEDLERQGAIEFIDFISSIPGVQFQDAGPGDREYIIRGINSVGASTVGVYFDEVPITASNAQDGGGRNIDLKLIDIDTVETFNGPQGTQYGANSMSGLVRYMPKKPDLYSFEGSANIDSSITDFGGYNQTLSGVVNVPISEDKFAARLVGWVTDNAGWIDQPNHFSGLLKDTNEEDTEGGRIMLRYTPTYETVIDYMYLRQDMFIGANSSYVPDGLEYRPGTSAEGDYNNYDFGDSPWDEQLEIHLLTVSHELELGNLVFSASNSAREINFFQDDSREGRREGEPDTSQADVQPQSRDVTSAELRYNTFLDGDHQFVFGYLYQDEENLWRQQSVTYTPGFDFFAYNPDNVPGVLDLTQDIKANFYLKQHALFGEWAYEITEALKLNVGGRYFRSEQSSEEIALVTRNPNDTSEPIIEESEDSQSSFKVSLGYRASDEVNYYGLISQGFRVGGLNAHTGGATGDIPGSFEPDDLTNYELGIKTEFLESDFRFNASIYYIDWQNMQFLTFYRDTPYITNAGSSEVYGFEVTTQYELIDNLNVEASLTVSDATLAESIDFAEEEEGGGRSFEDDTPEKGDNIPNIPDIQANLALEYYKSLSFGELIVRADWIHRGDTNTYFDTENTFNYALDATNIVSARATIGHSTGNWRATLYVNNLFNKIADNDALYADGENLKVFGVKPRTIGVRLSKQF